MGLLARPMMPWWPQGVEVGLMCGDVMVGLLCGEALQPGRVDCAVMW